MQVKHKTWDFIETQIVQIFWPVGINKNDISFHLFIWKIIGAFSVKE